jgi:hypothetical protein
LSISSIDYLLFLLPRQGHPGRTNSGAWCISSGGTGAGKAASMGFPLGVQFQMITKWIALGVTAIAGLVYVHYYASARLEAMPEKMRSSPAEINAQHQLELKSETPLQ